MKHIEYELQLEDEGALAVRKSCLQAFFPPKGPISHSNKLRLTSTGSYSSSVYGKDGSDWTRSSSRRAEMINDSFMTMKTEHSADTYKSHHGWKGQKIPGRFSKGDEDKSTRSSTANESFDLEDDISFSMASQIGLLNSDLSNSINHGRDASVSFSSSDHLRVAKDRRSKSSNSSSSSHKKSGGFSAMPIPLDDVEEEEEDALDGIIPRETMSNKPQGKFHVLKACIPTHAMKKKHKIPTYTSPHESNASCISPYTQYGSSVVVENDYTQILFQPRHKQAEQTSAGIQPFSPHQKQMTESAANTWKVSSPTAQNGEKSEIASDQQFLNTLAQALSNNYEQLQADLYKLTGKTEIQRLMDERNVPDVPQVLNCNIEDESDLVSEFGMGSTSGGKYNDHASVVRGMERDYNYSQRYRDDYGPKRNFHNDHMSPSASHESYEAVEEDPYLFVPRRVHSNPSSQSRHRGTQRRPVAPRRMKTLQEDVYDASEELDIIGAFGGLGVRKTPLTLSEAFEDFGMEGVMIKGKPGRNNTFDFSVDDEEDTDNDATNMRRRQLPVYPTSIRTRHRTHNDSLTRLTPPTFSGIQSQKKAIRPSEPNREQRRAQMLMNNAERMSNCGSSTSSGISPFNRSQKYSGLFDSHGSASNNHRRMN